MRDERVKQLLAMLRLASGGLERQGRGYRGPRGGIDELDQVEMQRQFIAEVEQRVGRAGVTTGAK